MNKYDEMAARGPFALTDGGTAIIGRCEPNEFDGLDPSHGIGGEMAGVLNRLREVNRAVGGVDCTVKDGELHCVVATGGDEPNIHEGTLVSLIEDYVRLRKKESAHAN